MVLIHGESLFRSFYSKCEQVHLNSKLFTLLLLGTKNPILVKSSCVVCSVLQRTKATKFEIWNDFHHKAFLFVLPLSQNTVIQLNLIQTGPLDITRPYWLKFNHLVSCFISPPISILSIRVHHLPIQFSNGPKNTDSLSIITIHEYDENCLNNQCITIVGRLEGNTFME